MVISATELDEDLELQTGYVALDAAALDAMQSHAILVNIARGDVVERHRRELHDLSLGGLLHAATGERDGAGERDGDGPVGRGGRGGLGGAAPGVEMRRDAFLEYGRLVDEMIVRAVIVSVHAEQGDCRGAVRHPDLVVGDRLPGRHQLIAGRQHADDGGTANGGQDTSAPQSFEISVLPVNDAPSFAAALCAATPAVDE